MNKKRTVIIIAIIVAILIAVVIGWKDIKPAKAPEVSGGVASSTKVVSTSTRPYTSSSTRATIQKTYSNGSFSLNYPSSWGVEAARPFSMDNFSGKYQNGGVIPAGGAQVTIATTTISGPLADIINTEIMGETSVIPSTVVVDGIKCQEVSGQATYGPGATSRDVSVYCVRGSELWKIYLSYPANDSAERKNTSDFNAILSSMKLTG